MRLVQVRVAEDSRSVVLDALEEANVEYVTADEGGDSSAVLVYFPLPDGAVESVLDRLKSAGLDEHAFTVITDIQSATTPSLEELESQYTQGPDDEVGLSHATLRTNAREVTPNRTMFVTFAALSAIVAAAGLLLNSAIVIVGAMVISPFAGASLSASVGLVIGDYRSMLDSLKSQLLGLVVAVGAATAAGAVFRWTYLVPPQLAIENISQVHAFSIPIVLTFAIAILAGTAGALALATDLPVSLAGVAVAAAIVPAAAASGIGLVWANPSLVLGAIVLLSMNVILINVSSFVALTLFGYRTSGSMHVFDSFRVARYTVAYGLLAVVVGVLLAATVVSSVQYFFLLETVNHNVDDVLESDEYASLELVDVETEYSGGMLAPGGDDGSTRVTVVVAHSTNESYPGLSAALQEAITADSKRAVEVRVRFLTYQTTGSNASTAVTNPVAKATNVHADPAANVLAAQATNVLADPAANVPNATLGRWRPDARPDPRFVNRSIQPS